MISVAMTTYNGEMFIEKQLDSILNQSLSVDEIIICDDNSTDNTIKIIDNIIKATNSNIKFKVVKNKDNVGYINNFYKAISLTKGDYILLADQDDIWKRDKVAKYIEVMKKNKYDALCSKFDLIDGRGNVIRDSDKFHINPFIKRHQEYLSEISLLTLAFNNICPGCTYCFTKKIKDIYLKLDNRKVIHDYQIMLISACCGKVALCAESLISYRLHDNNSIGFAKKERKIEVKIRKIRKIPVMVEFFYQLNKIHKVKFYLFYIILYYLRIPYIKEKVFKIICG